MIGGAVGNLNVAITLRLGLVASLFALGGCSSANVDESTSLASAQWVSPLAQLTAPFSDPAAMLRVFEARNRQQQEYIAACMLQAGFEYIPDLDAALIGGGRANNEGEFLPDNQEWITQYGYGVVSGHTSFTTIWEPPIGPNEAIVAALTDSERSAYDIALHGPLDARLPLGAIELAGEELVTALESQGCSGRALATSMVNYPFSLLDTDEFRPLQESIWEFDNSFTNSVELSVINADWASCMADGGFPGFTIQSDAQNRIESQRSALIVRLGGRISETSPQMRELQEQEITLALADFNCREVTNYWERVNSLRYAKESGFIDDHAVAFNALKDAMEQRDVISQ